MTFQHSGHGCAGAAGGGLGAVGIHLPDPKSVQEHISEHHERVTSSVQDHVGEHHERVTQVQQGVQDHLDNAHEGLGHSGGEAVSGAPLHLIFGDPVAAESHHYSLAAIPVGGGVTMSIVALIMVIALTLIVASMMVKTVAVRTVRHVGRHRQVDLSTTEVQAVRC